MNLLSFRKGLLINCFHFLLKYFDIINASIQREYGSQLLNALVTTITEVSERECIRNCDLAVQCLSINYLPSFRICQLNNLACSDENALMVSYAGSICIERKSQKKTYNDRKIPNHCVQHDNSHRNSYRNGECSSFIDCGLPPYLMNASIVQNGGTAFMSKVTYKCEEGTCQEGISHVGCQSDGRWSPIRVYCRFSENSCPDTWLTFGQSCYHFEKEQWLNNDAALDFCRRSGAYLAEVLSEEVRQYLWRMVQGTGSITSMGSIQKDIEGDWRWVRSKRRFNLIGHYPRLINTENTYYYIYMNEDSSEIYVRNFPHDFTSPFVCEHPISDCK